MPAMVATSLEDLQNTPCTPRPTNVRGRGVDYWKERPTENHFHTIETEHLVEHYDKSTKVLDAIARTLK